MISQERNRKDGIFVRDQRTYCRCRRVCCVPEERCEKTKEASDSPRLVTAFFKKYFARPCAGHIFLRMTIQSISHTFYDFEIEPVNSPNEIDLVKILSIDGRRFTYEVHGGLTDETAVYIKSLIDALVFNDMIVERTVEGYEAREATPRLKKHS